MNLRLLLCFVFFGAQSHAAIQHRWPMSTANGALAAGTVLQDTVGGADAVIVGVGATGNGTTVTLPGSPGNSRVGANTIAAYIDLPNGLVSTKTDFTLEIWAQLRSDQSNQRLFDFGRMSHNGVGTGAAPGEVTHNSTAAPSGGVQHDLFLNVTRGTNRNNQRIESRATGFSISRANSTLNTSLNTAYHFVVTYTAGAGAFIDGGQLRWWRDGHLVATLDLAYPLSEIEDVNNWLGRPNNPNDRTSHITYHEVRLYDHAMTQAEIDASRSAGLDPSSPPVANADTADVNPSGAVVIPVLDNDTHARAGRVEIVAAPQHGSAVPDRWGRVQYTHDGTPGTQDSFTYRVRTVAGLSGTAAVTIDLTPDLRLDNPALDVPSDPPPTAWAMVDAFPGLSFSNPLCLRTPPGETQRLFVCQKAGLLRLIPDVTASSPSVVTFLDLPALLSGRTNESLNSGSECGLLSVAFHPDYASNRQFFVYYSVNISGSLHQRVSRFTTQAGNPNAADPASEVILFQQFDEAGNHNGGDMHFGADGYLYISTGDEGGGNDPFNNAQRIDLDFHCALLRIDVDKKPGNLEPNPHPGIPLDGGLARYSVPIDNPLVHTSLGGDWDGTFLGQTVGNLNTVRTEFWATGLRNPWRFSIDPDTNELWLADVGQGAREEVNIVERGDNLGWAFREGFINGNKSAQAPANFDTLYHAAPIYEYRRIGTGGVDPSLTGNSVTGGFVYRGDRYPQLLGKYLFADFVSGHVWSLERPPSGPPVVERLTGEGAITAFGPDPSNGDVLATDNDGRLVRLVSGTPTEGFPATLSATGLFSDLENLTPAPGLIPYQINLPFWSDHAAKRRWFSLPVPGARFGFATEGDWQTPAGAVWVKHFDMDLTRGDPATRRRLETRLLVRNSTGAYGVSYRWNAAETEAYLVPDEGVDFPLTIQENGTPRTQVWRIPSRSECNLCHTPEAGHTLSFNTRQLLIESLLPGHSSHQLELLHSAGYLNQAPTSTDPNLPLPRHFRPDETAVPVEARVRSYLDVNCAYCHQPGGTAGVSVWDGRASVALFDTGLIHGPAVNNGGDPLNRLIVPGDPLRSVLLQRVAATNGFTRMPPIATNETDQAAIDLLTEWIQSTDAARPDYRTWRIQQFGNDTSPEGEPDFDDDGDGRDNRAEYIAGTHPRIVDQVYSVAPRIEGGQMRFDFDLPAGRSFLVEQSTNLRDWTRLDAPGNDGTPQSPGPVQVSVPTTAPHAFFRVRLWER